ncbi:hypothetical protein EC917_11291 [Bacillus thuringiensis]|uniref:Uncharacterized protein n=1 Tax=Bacillus thuringiensis TaxID=1428 RepID=A0A4R4BCA7_BACTU|nr:hypothetical protein EC917_11291 [Bacillus thuringiensis]TCW53142.1 hypothetical protein EC910_11291 [Bacillus thuringiensis]
MVVTQLNVASLVAVWSKTDEIIDSNLVSLLE